MDIIKYLLSKQPKNTKDLVDALNGLCAILFENPDQIKCLYQYTLVPSFGEFVRQQELRSAALCIIAHGCLDQKFIGAFIKHSCIEKLVLAVDDSWDSRQLFAVCLVLFRIFKRKVTYPRRHDKILTHIIPITARFLSDTSEVEFQLTVCRLWMVLHTYPLTKDCILKHNGLQLLMNLLDSDKSELRKCSYRTLIHISNLLDGMYDRTDEIIGLLLAKMYADRNEYFRNFAYFCFLEVSMQKDLTEFLIQSGILPKMLMRISSFGCSDLKRFVLITLRHFLPRLSQFDCCKETLPDFFQSFKRILQSKVDVEFHVLVVLLLNDLFFNFNLFKLFEEHNLFDTLLNILQTHIQSNRLSSFPFHQSLVNTCAVGALPKFTVNQLRSICSEENGPQTSNIEHLERKDQHHNTCPNLEKYVLVSEDDEKELYTFSYLMIEYSSTSIELMRTSLGVLALNIISKFLTGNESVPVCVIQNIVCLYEVLLEYFLFDSSHSKISFDILSYLISHESSFVLLVLNKFFLKVESYLPTGIQLRETVPFNESNDFSFQRTRLINEIILSARDLVEESLSHDMFLELGELEDKLLILHAVSTLSSDITFIRNFFTEHTLQILLQSLSNESVEIQRIGAVAINELQKFFKISVQSLSSEPNRPVIKNWYLHSALMPCCSHLSPEADFEASKILVDRNLCCYSVASYDVQFNVTGVNDSVGANRKHLCERSEHFRSLLTDDFREKESETILLRNIMKSSLVFIFHHLHGCQKDSSCNYQSGLTLLQKLDLLINCDYFQLLDLKNVVEDLLFDYMCCKNIPVIYEYSKTYNSPVLARKAVDEALCIRHLADFWNCFKELLYVEESLNFVKDVESILIQSLKEN